MASRGMCSRREADVYIEQGLVIVDGERISTLGAKVHPNARIVLEKSALQKQAGLKTILLHKPIGYVSGQPEPGYIPAITLIKSENFFFGQNKDKNIETNLKTLPQLCQNLAPAGRLDLDSSGLLILTEDGRIAKQLIGDNSEVEKEYLVRVDRLPNERELKMLNFGLMLDGKILRRAKVTIQNEDQLQFILREGRKRQIRRMCELVGLRVGGLKRVRIGKIRLTNLPLGKWRFLQNNESF